MKEIISLIFTGVIMFAAVQQNLGSIISIRSPELKQDMEWSLIATGDVMLGRSVNYKTLQYNDFTWAFKNTANLLKSADITFINLENPLVKNCPVRNDGMIFCGALDHTAGLTHAGVDVASLANNHSLNHGTSGLDETVGILNSVNIGSVGVGDPIYRTLIKEGYENIVVAFLGFNDVGCSGTYIHCADKENISEQIQLAKNNSDVIVIMYHWGSEYTHNPSDRQKDLGRYSIDEGADLVLGNHPHWTQPEEEYKGKLIVYSHGNFVFDQMWSEKTKEGVVGQYKFKGRELIDYELIPIYIEDYGQPSIVD